MVTYLNVENELHDQLKLYQMIKRWGILISGATCCDTSHVMVLRSQGSDLGSFGVNSWPQLNVDLEKWSCSDVGFGKYKVKYIT